MDHKPQSKKRMENFPQTVEKALNILEVFEDVPGSLGITELSQKVKLNKSTTYRIIQVLKRRGYVNQNHQTNKYELGYRILRISGRLLAKLHLRAAAKEALEELVKATTQTAQLAILDQKQMLFIDQIEGTDIIRLRLQIGARTPLYCTAAGKAILSFLSGEEKEKIVGREALKPMTQWTITSLAILERQMKRIRKRGFSVGHREFQSDISAVGAPVFGADGKVIAAVVLTMPSIRFQRRKVNDYGNLVRHAALEVSRNIGHIEDNHANLANS